MEITMRTNEKPCYLSVKVCQGLYDLLDAEATERGIPMIDVVVQRLAGSYGRLAEFGCVPRLPRGPKRGKARRRLVNGNGIHSKAVVA